MCSYIFQAHVYPEGFFYELFYGLRRMMEKLRIAAKLTHKRYGVSNHPLAGEIVLLKRMRIKILPHNKRISINAAIGIFKPKNSIDQIALKPN